MAEKDFMSFNDHFISLPQHVADPVKKIPCIFR